MRFRIVSSLLLGVATPLSAQDDTAYRGRAVGVSDEVSLTGGEEIYRGLCQGCHQPNGGGAEGAGDYPALAGNSNLEFPDYPVSVVLNGQGAMPPFSDLFDDQQVAAVVQFIQSHWGNEAEISATADLVENVRR